jgi:hypothetical protein
MDKSTERGGGTLSEGFQLIIVFLSSFIYHINIQTVRFHVYNIVGYYHDQ